MVALAKLTPHRVMRELYEQYIAYSRAYADSIATYTPPDDNLALVAVTAGNAIGDVCAAISYDSAPARGPLMPPAGDTVAGRTCSVTLKTLSASFQDLTQFVAGGRSALDEFQSDTADWRSIPSDIPASQLDARTTRNQ